MRDDQSRPPALLGPSQALSSQPAVPYLPVSSLLPALLPLSLPPSLPSSLLFTEVQRACNSMGPRVWGTMLVSAGNGVPGSLAAGAGNTGVRI